MTDSSTGRRHYYGYRPDLPDHRDFAFTPTITATNLPRAVDLRAGCGPVRDQGRLGSCHDDKTEVLTDRGFKPFSELDGSERLGTVDPKTSELSFESPTRIVRFPYQGPVYCADNQSLNFRVTPDHKMLVRRWNEAARTLNDSYDLVEAKNVGWYAGLLNRVVWRGESRADTYTLPGVQGHLKEYREPKDVPMHSWLRFLGVYLAEGTMIKRDEQGTGVSSYKVQVAASKEREKAFVRQALAEIGVHALELADRFTFSNRRVYEAMSSLGLEGVKAGVKSVPSFVFRQNADAISQFLAGHFAGDGCEQRGMRAHYTSSTRLANDLQTLIFLSGNETRVSVREARTSMTADGRTITGSLPEFRVSVCEQKNQSIDRKESMFVEQYDGTVYCAEVPTHHTLVTRREGKILVSGNCTGFAIGGAIEFEAKKQGLPAFTPSHLFIYYNERLVENTVESDSGASIRDGIKSVNHEGVCDETLWPYRIDSFTQRPPAAAYDDALLHQALNYQSVAKTSASMKACLAEGYPFVAGISIYESFESAEVARTGKVPMPQPDEARLGGHAILCIGYDNASRRFLFQNSWSSNWGASGFFTIPFSYTTHAGYACDMWTIRLVEGAAS